MIFLYNKARLTFKTMKNLMYKPNLVLRINCSDLIAFAVDKISKSWVLLLAKSTSLFMKLTQRNEKLMNLARNDAFLLNV